MATFSKYVDGIVLSKHSAVLFDDGQVVLRPITPPRKAISLSTKDAKGLRDFLNKHFPESEQSAESEVK